jgi:CheY-like chemotaxis protein
VKQCGGYLWVAGDPERGTSFTACFPQLDDALRPEAGAPSAEPLAAGGTLLLVEDEDGVRAVTRRFLESSGYQVLEAGDGAEALRICRSHTGRIDLVLTDVVMPKLSGPKLAERATLLHPETRVLYISGYADRAIVASGLLPSQSALLQKPFTRTALLSKVREMLAPHWPRPRPEASEPKTPSHPE